MIQPVKEKIILGIDPGTTIMGYGVVSDSDWQIYASR